MINNIETLGSIQQIQSITGLPSEAIGSYVDALKTKGVSEKKIEEIMGGIIRKNKELEGKPGEQTIYGQYIGRFVQRTIDKGVIFKR